MDSGIVLATGGYDHSIKFWHPHDGVCYRTASHPESVSLRGVLQSLFYLRIVLFTQQVNKLEVTPDKRLIVAAGK